MNRKRIIVMVAIFVVAMGVGYVSVTKAMSGSSKEACTRVECGDCKGDLAKCENCKAAGKCQDECKKACEGMTSDECKEACEAKCPSTGKTGDAAKCPHSAKTEEAAKCAELSDCATQADCGGCISGK